MGDRNRSGVVLRLVAAPRRSDPDEHVDPGAHLDDPDGDVPADATDAGPLFW
jgi:hypothetical protein